MLIFLPIKRKCKFVLLLLLLLLLWLHAVCINYFYSFHIKQNTRFKFIYQISPSMDWSIACHCFPLAKYKSSRWNSNILKTKITLARNIEVDKQSWWQSVIQFVLKMVSKPLWWHHTNNRSCTNIWNGCVFVMEISFGAEKRPTNTYKQERSRAAHRTHSSSSHQQCA